MDLDINNYDYEDILKLFNVSAQFNTEDLKSAKKKTIQNKKKCCCYIYVSSTN